MVRYTFEVLHRLKIEAHDAMRKIADVPQWYVSQARIYVLKHHVLIRSINW